MPALPPKDGIRCSYLLSLIGNDSNTTSQKKECRKYFSPPILAQDLSKHIHLRHSYLSARIIIKKPTVYDRIYTIKENRAYSSNKALCLAKFMIGKLQSKEEVYHMEVEDESDEEDENPIIIFRQPGELAGKNTVTTRFQQVVDYTRVRSIKYGAVNVNRTVMKVSSIENRLLQLTVHRKQYFAFFAKTLIQSISKSRFQTAIDTHYETMYKSGVITLKDIKNSRLRGRVLQEINIGDTSGKKLPMVGKNLQEHARSLQDSCRTILFEVLGPFMNLYRSKISVKGANSTYFHFVDPIPLCLLNLHHPEMRSLTRKFQSLPCNMYNDAFIFSSNMNHRASGRIGETVQEIFRIHNERAMNQIEYKGSIPLLIRIFIDAAKVSDFSQRSVTPILIGIENLHPDLQVTIAAKTLVGYYPTVTVKETKGQDDAGVQQQFWHVTFGELITIIDSYHDSGGIVIDLPPEYVNKSNISGLGMKFFPYICAFGK